MKIQRKSLFLFWAWMDLFFVLQFLWWNIAHRRLPFYDDLLAYLQLLHTWGSAAVWLYPLNVLLIISIPLSMIFFFPPEPLCAVAGLGAGAAQAAVYAAFAIAGPVADSGCRGPACSDPGRLSAAL
ncbi:arginine:ornithine antiporter [Klebsiella pneumoniae subsp. pneumoniae]|uniref:Arginine:ornithine antiporter n=1 Tax=Klebsiella pneumoniae subsp. pneumoniae TaxID=72407 RepID=A0A378A2M3_KLEPN|nr:putative arginine/ornithine antiporter [Klebsiella pneumoniae IS22]STU96357.1 arginine:ornithine antiporter [Klebsiella pneumoniae subsp. pneumoniae]VTO28811.1 arginine:ornithine antiporter [Klebsiella pneumoniae]